MYDTVLQDTQSSLGNKFQYWRINLLAPEF